MTETGGARPIFVLGLEQRTGTNYLRDLLCCHADCAPVGALGEDHLVQHSQHLLAYADAVAGAWSPDWDLPAAAREQLLASLGAGLSDFLSALAGCEPPRRPVTKTPSVVNLEHFFALFPRAQLLVIVRDGRAVAASGARSFRGDLDDWTRRWAAGARRLFELGERHPQRRARMLVVRYEDLVEHLEMELRRILAFLGLDPRRYDWNAAKQLPVRGSSELRKGGESVHWEPVARAPGFDPLARFADWSPRQHARFNWLAGDGLAALGYTPRGPRPAGPLAWLRHGGETLLRRLRDRLARVLRAGER